jgi:dolichyl-phosphate beta-glucosyltransferase
MAAPALSIVVPTLTEECIIDSVLARVSQYLESRTPSWEIIVADDGSSDATVSRVETWTRADPRVRVVTRGHAGKGAAVRHGMMAARGAWRFMADADLSVSPQDWSVLLDAASDPQGADVIVASREAAGARRIGEPLARHVIGRVFNGIVQLLVVPGIGDTQCGFKLFRANAAEALFPRLTIEGFAFDVELLFLARRDGLQIREVGVVWTCRRGGRVAVRWGALAFADIMRIRWNHVRGRYRRTRS